MASDFLQRSRHGTIFYFRRRVPDDVRHIIARRQLYKSLSTSDRREAIIKARALATRTDGLFEKIRRVGTNKSKAIQADLIMELDVDDLGLPTAKVQTEAHDTPEDKQRGYAFMEQVAADRKQALSQRPAATTITVGKPLKDAVDEFLDGITKAKTFRTYRTALQRQAIPYFGADTPISSIDQECFAKYVNHIFADREKAHSTKDGYINAFTSMFGWLHARYPKSTPLLNTKKLIPQRDDAEDEQRDPFTMSQLRILIENAARFRDKAPHKFWVTVAAVFMGCRIEELAQVNLAVDLKHQSGTDVWYLDLNERTDADGIKRKSLKKSTSRRVVPIHSALIRHGFLKYLQAQSGNGATRPFEKGWQPWEEPAKGGFHWAHYIIRWGGRELEKLHKSGKLNRDGLKLGYFHSMRHTFTNVLAEQDVGEERRAALQGQAVAGAGENAKRYLKLRHDPRVLSGIVEKHLGGYVAILDGVMASA